MTTSKKKPIVKKRRQGMENWGIAISRVDREYACQCGKSVASGIAWALNALRAITANAERDLKGYFTPDEWKYMAYIMREESAQEAANQCSPDILINMLRNPKELFAGYITCDPMELSNKIEGLLCSHVLAIWVRVDHYWRFNDKQISLDDWAKF